MSEENPDILRRFKHVGYCWSNMPPDKEPSLTDFVEYARFQLCVRTHTLMKDPIWESYSDAEIMAEYFAWMYTESKEMREKLEAELGSNEDMYEWFDRMIEENNKELEARSKEFEDSIDFDPSSVMGSSGS